MHEHGVGGTVPFTDELCARLQYYWSRPRVIRGIACCSSDLLQLAQRCPGQSTVGHFLHLVGNASDQEIAAQPLGRHQTMALPPFATKLVDGQLGEMREHLAKVDSSHRQRRGNGAIR
jgi:hypothetical protein